MSKISIIVRVTAVILLAGFVCGPVPGFAGPENRVEIEKITSGQITFGTWEIEGYVNRRFMCEPCVKAHCSPCRPDHIVFSAVEKSPLDSYDDLGPGDLVIIVDDAESLKEGGRYRFLIQMLNVRTFEQPSNNLKLIHSEEVKSWKAFLKR